jgi:hypothetical protein
MDKKYIKNIIQKILDKEFSNQNRRRILEYDNRLNFCCPCCGDSHKNTNAKRGNLYFNRLVFICFNCDKKTSFDRMCKDFNEQIDPDKKLEIIEHLNSIITYADYEDNFLDAKFENLIDFNILEKVINSNNTNCPITDFKPIQVNGGIYKYLLNRGILPEFHKNIYQGKFWKNEDESEWIIIMLNRCGDKILGMQIRNLKEGKRRTFKIYNYENIHNWVYGDDVEIDMNEMIIYNKLSYYFNILNINLSDKITVFEGYLDSLFYPNSIGLVGVNTDSSFLENNNLDIQYFFDNDEAGYKKSEEKINSGYSVFLWKKLFNHIVENKKSDNPYELMNRISKVKDLGKLAEIIKNPYKKLELEKFFSFDSLDLKYIPKFIKRKKNKIEEKNYDREFKKLDIN